MKKLIMMFMVSFMLIGITGCGKKEDPKEDPPVDESIVVINDLEFKLEKEASFKDLCYITVEDFTEVEYDITIPYRQYNFYQEDGSNLLFFRIFYYKGKGIEYAAKDLGIDEKMSLEDGKNEHIEYQLYQRPRDDGGTMHFYFITRGKDTYVLNFVSKYDIKDFENKVVNSVHF